MNKHTRGPWEVRTRHEYAHEIFAAVNIGTDEEGGVLQPIYDISLRPSLMVGREDGLVYAMLTYDSDRQFPSIDFREMQKANAYLIAAAPDLLEAAKLAFECVGYVTDGEQTRVVCEALRAAIAKAEGK